MAVALPAGVMGFLLAFSQEEAKVSTPSTPNGGRLLTAREAADLLRASRAKLYRLLKAGELAGYKVGATYVFYESELHAYVRRQLGEAEAAAPGGAADGGSG